MTKSLSLVFFVSGAAALLFETLWFRQAGIALGNTIWATSLVTASFMGGLAIGNGLAARFGRRVQRPLLVFAGLELMVGVSGIALVLAFPAITASLAPILGALADETTLNGMRITVAFLLLLIPSSAMGATLPLLARTLEARAIIKAFCNVFSKCSLWTGSGFEWMLVGQRGGQDRVSEARFASQWNDPDVEPRLRESGLENPAQLGALFLADSTTLQQMLAEVLPLTDNHPYRLSPHMLFPDDYTWYLELMHVLRHEVGRESCFFAGKQKKLPLLRGKPMGMNKELPGQCNEAS